ncbi:MAG TPA: universal stress protein [Natronosporangium sp.]|nr:universal stress protein [Natronosporangium sp.]
MEADRRPVVAGVDGSPTSLAAADRGARIAYERGVPLVLIHGFLHPFGFGTATLDPYAMMPPEPSLQAEEMLAQVAREAREQYPGLSVSHQQVFGGAAPTLVEASKESSLVVVGCRGHGGFADLLLGSVSAQVVSHAYCPVLVVRPVTPAPLPDDAPVVVGVDGSETAGRALVVAGDEAARQRRPLHVIVADVPDDTRARQQADALLSEAIATVHAAHPQVAVVPRAGYDRRAGEALLAASHDAAMLVVGSRGRGGFTGLLLGSVSQLMVHHAACSVLVVPPADRSAEPAS